METTMISACLLGSPTFSRDGHDLDVPGSCKPLLSYLLLHGDRRIQRPALSSLIAPDRAETSARRQLNTAVWRLRRLLDDGRTPGAEIIVSDAGGLTIGPECQVWVDALDFELTAAQCRVPAAQWDLDDAERVAAAVEMYRGDLLEGVYDDWVLEQRARLSDLYRTCLVRLAEWHRRAGELGPAIGYAERAVATEGLREDLQRLLISLYLQAGLDDLAITQFHRCRVLLAAELGVRPLPETEHLAEVAIQRLGTTPSGLEAAAPPAVDVPAMIADLESTQAELSRISARLDHTIAVLRTRDH